MTNTLISHLLLRLRDWGSLTLSAAAARLAAELDLDALRFLDANRRALPGQTLYRNALHDAVVVEITLRIPPNEGVAPTPDARPSLSVSTQTDRPLPAPPPDLQDDLLRRVVLELARRDQQGRPMWIGYVLQTLLPQLGVSGPEASAFYRQLESEGLVVSRKVPNPKNPQFPSTMVALNREHPRIRSMLNEHRDTGDTRGGFARVRVRGEPVSETLIRERR